MSALFGFVQFQTEFSPEEVKRRVDLAMQSLTHRGENTLWFSECGKVVLSNAVATRSTRVLTSFSGELYNHKELKLQYADLFRLSNTTSAVAGEMLETFENHSLNLFDGSFALASFSQSQRQLWLAVDPMGEKNLYVYVDGNKAIFSSEIKAILAFGEVDAELDATSLEEYLIYGEVRDSRTLYKNISKIPGGHRQVLDLLDGPHAIEKYWDLPVMGPTIAWEKDSQSELQFLFRKAVQKRLGASSTTAVLISGGLASAAVAFEAGKSNQIEKLKTASIGFMKSQAAEHLDESPYSRLLASKLHSDHVEFQVDINSVNVDTVLRHSDEAFSNPALLAHLPLYREASKVGRILLSGVGHQLIFPQARTPKWLKLFGIKNRSPKTLGIWGVEGHRAQAYEAFKSFSRTHLPHLDRLSAWYGSELRFPFLDKDLVEFAFRLAPEAKTDWLSKNYGPSLGKTSSQHLNFVLTDFMELKQSEDFREIEQLSLTLPKIKNDKDFFATYALENFLKRHVATDSKQKDEFRKNLSAILEDGKGVSLEWAGPS